MRQKIAKKIKKAIEKTIEENIENRELIVLKSYRRAKEAYSSMTMGQKKSFNKSLEI